jgi:hypothetical protein
LRRIRKDSLGYALSLDLLLALIPLTIMLGMVTADMDNMLYNVQDTIFESSMDRVAQDTANALVATSGTPQNWDKTGIKDNTTIGLANYNEGTGKPVESSISANKFAAAAADYNRNRNSSALQRMVGNQYGFCVKVFTLKDPKQVGLIGNSSAGNGAKDVMRVERIVLFSQFDTLCSLKNIKYTGETRVYTIDTSNFQTSYDSNQSYDYWILMVNNGFTGITVNINSNQIPFDSSNITEAYQIDPSYLNLNETDKSKFYDNTVTLNGTGSFPSSMDFYIVQTVKNSATADDITADTVVPKKCKFIFYLWAK